MDASEKQSEQHGAGQHSKNVGHRKHASNNNNNDEFDDTWLQARYLVVLAAFIVNAVCFIMRVNLSVAIVAISLDSDTVETKNSGPHIPHYDWDAAVRGMILSGFFWGCTITQIPASYLVQRYGPRVMIFLTMLVCTAATFFFEPAAALGWQYACATRVVLGLAQGVMMPACHTLLARWSPPDERARMTVYAYSGDLFGTVVALSGAGVLSATSIGWPLVFHVSGVLGLVSAALWLWLAADTPEQHPLASHGERLYIETSINGYHCTKEEKASDHPPVPWLGILTSGPMLALTITHCAQAWGFWTILNEIPSYMKGVLNFDLAKNGVLSALPYLTMWAAGVLLSWIGDLLLHRGTWRVATSRKVGNSIGHYGSAIALILLGFAGENECSAVIILTLAVTLNAGVMVGFQVNFIDLSPNFAGTLIAVTHCIASVMGILSSLVAGFIVTQNDNAEQWQVVFLIAAGFFIVGNTIFLLMGSGTVQPWNDPDWRPSKENYEKQPS